MAGDFYRIVTAAITDFVEHGFDHEARLEQWLQRIRTAALQHMVPLDVIQRDLRRSLQTVFRREVDKGGALRGIPRESSKVARYTLARVRPQLQAELDRRIAASAGLIRLNRAETMEKTLRRFSGWASSIAPGGTEAADKRAESQDVRKALAQLPYAERRLAIDQGHKLTAAIKDVVARDAGVLAYVWHHVHHMPGYQARPDHVARSGNVYLLRGTWATERGLVRPMPSLGYYDEITAAGQEVFCRCSVQGLFSLGKLPPEMLTIKGTAELERARSGRAA